MKKFEVLKHKADLKIKVFGETKEEIFLNALSAMTKLQKAEIGQLVKRGKTKRKIKIKSFDLTSLLVDFLSEVLYLGQTNKEVYKDVKFLKFNDPSTGSGQAEIEGELLGQKIERFGEDIKGVTYHNLDILRTKDGNWEAIILFDI